MRHLVQRIPNLSAVANDEEGRYEGDEAEQMMSKKRRREGDEEDTAYLGEENSRKQQRTSGDDAPRQDSMPSKMEALLVSKDIISLRPQPIKCMMTAPDALCRRDSALVWNRKPEATRLQIVARKV